MLADDGASTFGTVFSAEASRPLAGGTLRLLLVLPLRVERGPLELSLPVGSQIDAGMDWTGTVVPGMVIRIGPRLIREPDHVAGRNLETVVFAGRRIGMQQRRRRPLDRARAPSVEETPQALASRALEDVVRGAALDDLAPRP